jgi:hypothetical protein
MKSSFFAKVRKYVINRTALGIVLGGTAGYLYYYYVGCSSGSCPITSSPTGSVIYGTLIGGLVLHKPLKKVKASEEQSSDESMPPEAPDQK